MQNFFVKVFRKYYEKTTNKTKLNGYFISKVYEIKNENSKTWFLVFDDGYLCSRNHINPHFIWVDMDEKIKFSMENVTGGEVEAEVYTTTLVNDSFSDDDCILKEYEVMTNELKVDAGGDSVAYYLEKEALYRKNFEAKNNALKNALGQEGIDPEKFLREPAVVENSCEKILTKE